MNRVLYILNKVLYNLNKVHNNLNKIMSVVAIIRVFNVAALVAILKFGFEPLEHIGVSSLVETNKQAREVSVSLVQGF